MGSEGGGGGGTVQTAAQCAEAHMQKHCDAQHSMYIMLAPGIVRNFLSESPSRKQFRRRFCLTSQERSANSVFATSPLPSRGPHGGGKSIWLHYPCFLGVPMVGRNQPSKEWMWWKRATNGRKLVKLGENPNIPYPECERSIKIPVVKQQ